MSPKGGQKMKNYELLFIVDASLADEERQQKIFELTETYGNLINSLTEQNEDIKANLRESAMAELFDLYGKDENN